MAYFDFLPNVYVGEGVNQDEAYKYRLVKNIFRRITAREDLDRYTTFFERAPIEPNSRPCDIADAIFGDPFLDLSLIHISEPTRPY